MLCTYNAGCDGGATMNYILLYTIGHVSSHCVVIVAPLFTLTDQSTSTVDRRSASNRPTWALVFDVVIESLEHIPNVGSVEVKVGVEVDCFVFKNGRPIKLVSVLRITAAILNESVRTYTWTHARVCSTHARSARSWKPRRLMVARAGARAHARASVRLRRVVNINDGM